MSLDPPPSRDKDFFGTPWQKWFSLIPKMLDRLYAALAGSSTQTFSVGTATAAAHAVRLDQFQSGQITFPATQNPSSDANVLDDYEEGTWTPNQGAGLSVVGAFSSSGTYTKIGRAVTVTLFVGGATSIAVSAGGVISSNLPFTSAATPIHCGSGISSTGTNSIITYISGGVTSVQSANALGAIGTGIYSSITYQV